MSISSILSGAGIAGLFSVNKQQGQNLPDASSFGATLAAVSSGGITPSSSGSTGGISGAGSASAGSSSSAASQDDNSGVTEFMKYMQKTPAQRFQEAWLKQHGISPEKFAAMSPDEKKAITDQMKQDLQAKAKELAENQNGKPRVPVDILA
jgi:hypothetical protein